MKKSKILTVKEIENIVRKLSWSQGCYGRLLNNIKEDRTILMQIKKSCKPRTKLDVVMFLA